MLAVPEHSHPGESQSNGLAERAIRSIEDQVRVLKAALEARLSARIPSSHPMMSWIVHHAAFLLNKYHLKPNGRTAYGELHGRETIDRIAELGRIGDVVCSRQAPSEARLALALRGVSGKIPQHRPQLHWPPRRISYNSQGHLQGHP